MRVAGNPSIVQDFNASTSLGAEKGIRNMRLGLKLILFVMGVGACSWSVQASSADINATDISKSIEVTLMSTKTQSDACKSERRSVSQQCGQSYIYPVVSKHPDATTETKINTFITSLQPALSHDLTRMESWTEVTLNTNNILSLSYSQQTYGPSAFGGETMKSCDNLDLRTGDKIALEDVLQDRFEVLLPQIIAKNLNTELNRRIPSYLQNVLSKKGPDWTLNAAQAFHLNERDLTLCFEPRELSSEIAAPVSIPLPFSVISNLIDTDGLLSFALATKAAPVPEVTPARVTLPKSAEPAPELAAFDAILEKDLNRIGSIDYTCLKDNVAHKISVVEYDDSAPFICTVEYDKQVEKKVLWRSRKTKSFCLENAEKLATKYEKTWGYTCGRTSTLPES